MLALRVLLGRAQGSALQSFGALPVRDLRFQAGFTVYDSIRGLRLQWLIQGSRCRSSIVQGGRRSSVAAWHPMTPWEIA